MEVFTLTDDLLMNDTWSALDLGFTTRMSGNLAYQTDSDSDAVLQRRKQLAAKTGIDFESWVFAEQVHGTHIHEVSHADIGRGIFQYEDGIAQTDALYTREKNVMLATFHADCTPIYFYAPNYHLVGLAHAGWLGTVAELTQKFLLNWIGNEAVAKEDIFIIIGPCISQKRYEVGQNVVEALSHMYTEHSFDYVTPLGNEKYLIDTRMLNYNQAIQLGIPAKNIQMSEYCTFDDSDLFYSYRREGTHAGRMLAFIGMK